MGNLSIGFSDVSKWKSPLKTTKKDPEEKKVGNDQKNNDVPTNFDYMAGMPLGLNPYNSINIEKKYDERPQPSKIDKSIIAKQKKVGLYDLPMGNNASDLKSELKRNYQANADRLNKSPYTAKEKAEALASLCPKNRDKTLFVLIYLKNRNPKLFADIMGELKKQLSDKDYSWLKDSMAKISITRSGQLIDPATNKEIDFLSYMGTDAQSKREGISWVQNGIRDALLNFSQLQENDFEKEFAALKELGGRLNKLYGGSSKGSKVSSTDIAPKEIKNIVSKTDAELREGIDQRLYDDFNRSCSEIAKKAEAIFAKPDKEMTVFYKKEVQKMIKELLTELINEGKKLQIKFKLGKLDAAGLESGEKRLNEIAEFVKERYR